MSNEPYRAIQWAKTVLTGDATFTSLVTGGVWRYVAPQGTQPPYAVLWIASAPDNLSWNRHRVWTDVLLGVKVVGPESMDTMIDAAMARADVLLNLQIGSGGSQNVLGCARESAIDLEELVNNVLWSSPGGLYRAHVA